jgi:hypothetical protein
MESYVSFFTRFLHAVTQVFRESEAFLFHTRLAHVSSALRERDPAGALDWLALMASGVGGGTKIGECLAAFNRMHARRVIHSRTCVMTLSDGYDTGPQERLSSAMRDLKPRCKRIVWLNPLTGRAGFEPGAPGMQAALPYLESRGARTLSGEGPMGVLEQAALRQAQGQAFALATVVRTVSVTAAKAGAKALIGPDGAIEEGWIGGGCARAAVVKAARQ